MEINATLLIQGIHFVVAWALLKHVLLRSLFECIEIRKNYLQSLRKSIESQDIMLNMLTEECDSCIKAYCRHFISNAPSVTKIESLYFFNTRRMYVKPIEIKDEVVEKYTEQLALILKEQLEHVRG
jgi:hypothetical protein